MRLAYFKVGEIEAEEGRIEAEQKADLLLAMAGLFRKRMESHFIKYLLSIPIYLLKGEISEESYDKGVEASWVTSELVRDMYSTGDLVEIEKEVALSKRYMEQYVSALQYSKGKKTKVRVETQIENSTRNQLIPSFILINLIHNAVLHNLAASSGMLSKELIISIRASLENEVLSLRIEDNGKGFEEDKTTQGKPTLEEKNFKNSTELMQDFFAGVNQILKQQIIFNRGNLMDEGKNVTGAFVELQIPEVLGKSIANLLNRKNHD
ncbi:MAG: hypothetical protein KDD02_24275 [Phaeodactylibacter sp.]|nr:hypothetical protein [Phaeodactylibacter sp.]